MTKPEQDKSTVNVDADTIKSGRDTVVGGRDVNTGASHGDSSAQTQSIIVRGVTTTKGDLHSLEEALQKLEEAIKKSNLQQDEEEAALHNASVLREQMTETTDKKANDILLSEAAEALYKYGPAITGALVAAFTTPLGGAIATVAGTRALEFYKKVSAKKT